MAGRVWTWLLEFEPAREAMRREVKGAVDLVMDETESAHARLRERHRTALGRATQETDELRAKVAEMTTANTSLLGDNAALRAQVAELEESAQQDVTERAEITRLLMLEQETAATRQWQGATTDVFCCQSCWAFWFLSTAPDRMSCMVRGPYGRHDVACTVCADPVVMLPAAKNVILRRSAEDRVPRPAPIEEPHTETTVANAELAAIADGLARLPKVASLTVAWIAADLAGPPELPAKVLTGIATRTTMPVPLDGVVAGIRAFIEVGAPKTAS